MKSLARIRRIGGSLMVTIPKEIVKEESLVEGELIEVNVEKVNHGGFGMLKGIRPFTREDELVGQLNEK